ncbi:phospholipase D-like domain-containing protein [Streptomyces sp. NPDC058084]|uniref:phospholipase D-like domain-containing protein n=1 Tax=Streptomyces sp. NPDC058084 TaxID=3346333 RepID=UPI0036EB3523
MRIRALRRLAAASALVVATSLLGAPQALAEDPAPVTVRPKAVFNDPATSPNAVRDELVTLIRNTEPNGLIRGSIYLFTDGVVRDALAAAHRDRGVRVQILFDHDAVADQKLVDGVWKATGSEFSTLGQRLGRVVGYGESVDADATGSFVLGCPENRGCIGNRGLKKSDGGVEYAINHNKYFLFSKVGATPNVVFQSSANLTANHRTGMFNNAVTVPHTGLYDEYTHYWKDQLTHGTSGAGLDDYYRSTDVGAYKTYFFPRIESDRDTRDTSAVDPREDASTDTVVSLLKNVSCATTPATEIRVAMYAFTRTQVADRLAALQAAGCRVRVVVNGEDGNVGSGVRAALTSAGLTTLRQCAGTDAGSYGVHSKYLLIDGSYLGSPRKVVFTGSHNYTYPNLRSQDETLLKIDQAEIFEAYRQNFDTTLLGSAACQGALSSAP